MVTEIFLVLLVLMALPAAVKRVRLSGVARMKAVVGGLVAFNLFILLVVFSVFLASGVTVAQESQEQGVHREGEQNDSSALIWKYLSAAIAVSIATIAAGVAVSITGSAAIGGMSQNPEIFGRALVFVGLAEGIAIYGLIISFMILAS